MTLEEAKYIQDLMNEKVALEKELVRFNNHFLNGVRVQFQTTNGTSLPPEWKNLDLNSCGITDVQLVGLLNTNLRERLKEVINNIETFKQKDLCE